MSRILLVLLIIYLAAHLVLIEAGREVIVLRTQDIQGAILETRLWIVDDDEHAWIHGNRGSAWMRNLQVNPVVEIQRDAGTRQYHAVPVPGPHRHVHELRPERGANRISRE